MQRKPVIKDLLKKILAEELSFAATLSEAEREHSGEDRNWAVRDYLPHLAAYRQRMANNLAAAARGGEFEFGGETDDINAGFFAAHRHQSWEELIHFNTASTDALLEHIDRLSEADLERTDFFPWLRNNPLWQSFIGNGCTHPVLHLGELYARRGNPAEGIRLNEELAGALSELSRAPDWQGVVQYNLACSYALGGRPVEAIDALRRALALNPTLTEWSQQDPDFASLRQQEAYQAIYT